MTSVNGKYIDWEGLGIDLGADYKASDAAGGGALENVEGFVGASGNDRLFELDKKRILLSDDQALETVTLVGEGYHQPNIESGKNFSRAELHQDRDQEYFALKLRFDEAVGKTLEHLKLSRKSELVNPNGQIISQDVADALLARFRNELRSDVGRIDVTAESQAKAKHQATNLDRREQIFFKLLLQRELGLEFGNNDVGKANAKAFFFTVGLNVLNSVNPSSKSRREAEALAKVSA